MINSLYICLIRANNYIKYGNSNQRREIQSPYQLKVQYHNVRSKLSGLSTKGKLKTKNSIHNHKQTHFVGKLNPLTC